MGFGSPPQVVVRHHFEGTKRPPVRRSRRGRLPWGWIWLAILPATILHAEYPSKIINGLRATCLDPLQKLHRQVERVESIAHLTQADQEAVRALDVAMAKIEESAAQPVEPPGGGDDPPVVDPPKVKPRAIIKPVELIGTSYLETPDDIDKFLADLRQKLEAAINSGQHIQIR